MVISGNRYLSLEEMTVNGNYIMSYFLAKGWSKNAIAGMLGNMETESTINPGIWQNLDKGNTSLGFGLVQWTPATKLINWANSSNLNYEEMDAQLMRIEYELENGLQWIPTSSYPLSFQQFSVSTESPEYLAQAFLRNYERPANQDQPNRSTQARYWFDNLDGENGGGIGEKPCFPTSSDSVVTSPYGWRIHPITGIRTFHAGTDFAHSSRTSQPIYATQTGVITVNQWSDSGGWMIYIKHHGDPYHSRYLHLVSQSPIPVGTTVTKCQEIGMTGNTGASEGIHLHFEIATSQEGFGTENGTIDPELYLQMNFGGGQPPSPDNKKEEYVALLLCDAVNGWKF